MTRALICGGRHYADAAHFAAVMTDLLQERQITEVVTGGAPGADALAALWAGAHLLVLHVIRADWQRYGRAAGPRRNQEMVDRFAPDLVVAFPGGQGTADMVRRAKAAGIEVIEP